MRFPIGTQFIRRGRKAERIETVCDYHTTRNLAGEVVKERYVCSHQVMGQCVFDNDVTETTIAMGRIVPTEAA